VESAIQEKLCEKICVESATQEQLCVESATQEKLCVESATQEKLSVESATQEKLSMESATQEKICVESATQTTQGEIESKIQRQTWRSTSNFKRGKGIRPPLHTWMYFSSAVLEF